MQKQYDKKILLNSIEVGVFYYHNRIVENIPYNFRQFMAISIMI